MRILLGAPEAREEIATVLFLDVVGFSSASLKCTPVDAFRELKTMFDRITRLVQQHGGTVDRSFGDGMLAYFTEVDSSTGRTHADRAVACGIAILRAQVEDILIAAAEPQSFVLPIRIGINSGNVYIGDLGSDDRSDFTLIGSAVNFGQRLEAACEINRIMIGQATMSLMTEKSADTPGMRRRPIIDKTYRDPVGAFEYDPFISNPDDAERAIVAYRNFAEIKRTEDRLPCDLLSLTMATTYGFAAVMNVSPSGMLLRLDTYIARGAIIHIESVMTGIEHVTISPMIVEVRWGVAQGKGTFLHGCLIKSLNKAQKAELWELWQDAIADAERKVPA